MTVLRLAVLSGMLGATASCLAKFALAPESPVVRWTLDTCIRHSSTSDVYEYVSWVPRGICLLLMVSLNVIMVGTFLEGMQESGSVAGTALASAANFGMSTMYGIFLWDESVNKMWLLGFCMVVAGAGLLSTVTLAPLQ